MTDETRNENEEWQLRAKTAEAALQRLHGEADARLIRAELKAEAIRAGMIDLDGLKFINTEEIPINEQGEVTDGAGVLARLKQAKPWLFGSNRSSSPAAQPPRPEPPRPRHASELSHAEWQTARAALLRRR